jgi:hypothetical protein
VQFAAAPVAADPVVNSEAHDLALQSVTVPPVATDVSWLWNAATSSNQDDKSTELQALDAAYAAYER